MGKAVPERHLAPSSYETSARCLKNYKILEVIINRTAVPKSRHWCRKCFKGNLVSNEVWKFYPTIQNIESIIWQMLLRSTKLSMKVTEVSWRTTKSQEQDVVTFFVQQKIRNGLQEGLKYVWKTIAIYLRKANHNTLVSSRCKILQAVFISLVHWPSMLCKLTALIKQYDLLVRR